MNIKNDQIACLKRAVDLLAEKERMDKNTTRSDELVLNEALCVFHELEYKRTISNAKQTKIMSEKRKINPLYGRSKDYIKARVEKAKKIIELYGKED